MAVDDEYGRKGFGMESGEKSKRIMIVDDEPGVLEVTGKMLERMGYEIQACFSGSDALQFFAREPSSFDLVLTDSEMSDMRGEELAGCISMINPDIPVILFSGYAEPGSEIGERTGIRAFLNKPVKFQDLRRAINDTLNGGLKIRETQRL